MTVQEKRAILASWASDACAVEAVPDLRSPPSAPLVRFDYIMDALKAAEQINKQPRFGGDLPVTLHSERSQVRIHWRWRRSLYG
jgi:hypothetical protein